MEGADLQPARDERAVVERRELAPRDVATPTGEPPRVTTPQRRQGTVDATIKRLIPMESSIMRSIFTREPRNIFINANQPQGAELDLLDLSSHIRQAPPGGSALIIQDINIEWADFLLSRFPDSLSPAFFAKHMIRLDSSMISGKTASKASEKLEGLKAALSEHLPTTRVDSSQPTEDRLAVHSTTEDWLMVHLNLGLPNDGKGIHVDCDLGSLTDRNPEFPYPASDSERWDVFEKYGSKKSHWRSIRTRISWCRLEDHACKPQSVSMEQTCIANMGTIDLILVSGMPDMSKGSNLLWNPSSRNPLQRLLDLRIDSKPSLKAIRSPIIVGQGYSLNEIYKPGSTDCLKTTLQRLLQQHTPDSVFNPGYVPVLNSTTARPGQCHVFAWLLAASSWQLVVTAMESDLQRIQQNAAIKANDEAFSLLRDFRRQVADAEVLVAQYRDRLLVTMEGANEWVVDGDPTHRIDRKSFWNRQEEAAASISGQAQEMDIRHLRSVLAALDGRVNAMAKTVNEEIQVVIGSVQVEDAKVVKRQTEVTVVLAVLAAIYLPLTLVTGIFGMNINEISQGVPDRVWVVKVRSWIFSVTIFPILVYAIVRLVVKYCRDRRKKLKDLDPEAQKLE